MLVCHVQFLCKCIKHVTPFYDDLNPSCTYEMNIKGKLTTLVPFVLDEEAAAKGQKSLKALRPPPSVPTAPHHPAHTPAAHVAEVKLPKVELPKFEGKSPSEYQGFISTFDSMIHTSTTIDDVTKLIYLKSCCLGRAKEIADGFTVTSDNYKELNAVLKAAYGLLRLVL